MAQAREIQASEIREMVKNAEDKYWERQDRVPFANRKNRYDDEWYLLLANATSRKYGAVKIYALVSRSTPVALIDGRLPPTLTYENVVNQQLDGTYLIIKQ